MARVTAAPVEQEGSSAAMRSGIEDKGGDAKFHVIDSLVPASQITWRQCGL
jgi:hypothetical protein